MKSKQFFESIRRLARERGLTVSLDKKRGKGSHALLKFGDRRTILKDLRKTVGPGLLRKMCRDLGITPEDLK